MSMISGWGGRVRGLFADTKGPWGPKSSGDEPEEPAQGPWGGAPKRGKRAPVTDDSSNNSSLGDFFRRGRGRFGGGGRGGLRGKPNA
jgi:membrane protease subunit HflK